MINITTLEAFYLAYLEKFGSGKILIAAAEINPQEAEKMLAQGLADHMGVVTEEDENLFSVFGPAAKEPEPLDGALLSAHCSLSAMVERDYAEKLSLDEAATLIKILNRTGAKILMPCGAEISADVLKARWMNTHRDKREELLKEVENG